MSHSSLYKKNMNRNNRGVGGNLSVGVRRTPRTAARAKKNTFTQLRTYMSERARSYDNYWK